MHALLAVVDYGPIGKGRRVSLWVQSCTGAWVVKFLPIKRRKESIDNHFNLNLIYILHRVINYNFILEPFTESCC